MAARKRSYCMASCLALMSMACELDPKQRLGEKLFEDENLSANSNQSCAACHAEQTGWTGPTEALNQHGSVYEGSFVERFAGRKPNSSAYATLAPRFDHDESGFFGGVFWDGRGTGWKLGNPAADQAQGPFLNPLEQALPSAGELVTRACAADYGEDLRRIWGATACTDTERGYTAIALSIEAFENSSVMNAFSSKFDEVRARRASLSMSEGRGLKLFQGAAKCANCHALDRSERPLFTDFRFENPGFPASRLIPRTHFMKWTRRSSMECPSTLSVAIG